MMKRRIVKTLAAICLVAVLTTSMTAHATTAPATSSNALAGVNITILDTTTPATMHGWRGNNSYFTAADGRTLGIMHMSMSDARVIMDRVAVTDANGNWLPPGNWPSLTGMEWAHWFADEFNRLRGLCNETRDADMAAERIARQQRYRAEIIRLVNLERERHGLHTYEINQDLMRFSQTRASEVARSFSHTRPNGLNAGYEIITGAASPENALRRWMDSPGHRAAILNPRRTTVGAGVYITHTGGVVWQMYFYTDDLSPLRNAGFEVN